MCVDDTKDKLTDEILRNIVLVSGDTDGTGKLTDQFFARSDIPESKKNLLKELLS